MVKNNDLIVRESSRLISYLERGRFHHKEGDYRVARDNYQNAEISAVIIAQMHPEKNKDRLFDIIALASKGYQLRTYLDELKNGRANWEQTISEMQRIARGSIDVYNESYLEIIRAMDYIDNFGLENN